MTTALPHLLSWLPVVLVAGAIWPVWGYLARAATAPGGDPAGACVLLVAFVWSMELSRRQPEPARRGVSIALILLLMAYATGYGALPALARAILGLGAFSLALLGLPGVGRRERSGLAALVILAAPSPDTLNFILGGPLRAVATGAAAAWLNAMGLEARVDGAALWVDERLFSVDAPCSGVNGLWVSLVAAAALATWRRLSPLRTAALLAAAAALCVPANAWRAVALIQQGRISSIATPAAADLAHTSVGLVIFAALLLALYGLTRALSGGEVSPSTHRPQSQPRDLPSAWHRLSYPALLALALIGAGVPLLPASPKSAERTPRGVEWPREWLGQPLQRLPETALDRRWAAAMPGPIARFALPSGEELLLRRVDHPGRGLHPPEDCYRGNGYQVTSLSPVQAPAPPAGIASSGGSSRPVVWRRFQAARAGETWEVRGLILSDAGPTYSDPAWWWWRVAGPGATDRGPWWAVTIQRRIAPSGRPMKSRHE